MDVCENNCCPNESPQCVTFSGEVFGCCARGDVACGTDTCCATNTTCCTGTNGESCCSVDEVG